MRGGCLIIGLIVTGCAADMDDPRSAWLQSTLTADNRLVILRFPDGARGKFAKMASTPYRYLRGTAAQYTRDVLEPGAWHRPTRFGGAAASRRMIVGDAHLENVGTYFAGRRRLIIDFNDFDAATFGPYHLDVWRLCTSIGVAFADAGPAARRRWMRATAFAYAQAMQALAAGGEPTVIDELEPGGVILADLLRRARRDGDEAEQLATYTRLEGTQRVMFFGEVDPPGPGYVGDVVRPPTPAEAVTVRAAMAAYPQSLLEPTAFTVRGISRRHGAGVSSYPLPRFYVLLDDDLLVEIKESADAVRLPGIEQQPRPREAHNGARLLRMQRELQAYVDDDPHLGVAALGVRSFRVRRREGYQKNLSVERLRERWLEGVWTDADLEIAFEGIGRLLARAHGGAEGSDRHRGAAVIAAAIDGDFAGFASEATAFALAYAEAVIADHQRFLTLRRLHGPLLGAR